MQVVHQVQLLAELRTHLRLPAATLLSPARTAGSPFPDHTLLPHISEQSSLWTAPLPRPWQGQLRPTLSYYSYVGARLYFVHCLHAAGHELYIDAEHCSLQDAHRTDILPIKTTDQGALHIAPVDHTIRHNA